MGLPPIAVAALCCPLVQAATVLPGFMAAVPETLEPPTGSSISYAGLGVEVYSSPSHAGKQIKSKAVGYISQGYDPPQVLRYDRPWEDGKNICRATKDYEGETTADWCWNFLSRDDNNHDDWVFTKILGSKQNDKMIGATSNSNHYSGWRQSEIFEGKGGNDTVRGEHGDDYIFGGPGCDRLHGDSGDDTIVGNEAGDDSPDMDIIFTGTGSDTVYAQAGDDWIYTDQLEDNNLDWLSGGTGADTFVISQPFGPNMGSDGWTLDAIDLLLGLATI
eukprot:Clim_evm2s38 gene=Clim_evmTU2s38